MNLGQHTYVSLLNSLGIVPKGQAPNVLSRESFNCPLGFCAHFLPIRCLTVAYPIAYPKIGKQENNSDILIYDIMPRKPLAISLSEKKRKIKKLSESL